MKKHALVTGGNKGIGLAITKLLLSLDFKVTVVARDFSLMEKLSDCDQVVFDLSDIGGIAALVASLEPVDVLVNNAGVMNGLAHDNYPLESRKKLMDINFEAPVELMSQVSKAMVERKSGRIINITSVAAHIGFSDVWYAASKAALVNATKSFSKILGPHDVLVNSIAPGIVETEMATTIPEKRQQAFLASVNSGRFAQPKEIAQTVAWLATESPVFLNGSCIDMNDGSYLR